MPCINDDDDGDIPRSVLLNPLFFEVFTLASSMLSLRWAGYEDLDVAYLSGDSNS